MFESTNRIRTFKLIHPEGNSGLSDVEILDLFNKWYADNPHLNGAEAAYQLSLHMKKRKNDRQAQSVGA